MEILEKIQLTPQSSGNSTMVKLERDSIGGIRLVTEDNQILENVFVKEYKRLEGSVTRVFLEVVYIAPGQEGKNW